MAAGRVVLLSLGAQQAADLRQTDADLACLSRRPLLFWQPHMGLIAHRVQLSPLGPMQWHPHSVQAGHWRHVDRYPLRCWARAVKKGEEGICSAGTTPHGRRRTCEEGVEALGRQARMDMAHNSQGRAHPPGIDMLFQNAETLRS